MQDTTLTFTVKQIGKWNTFFKNVQEKEKNNYRVRKGI